MFLATGFTDLRRGIDGLASIVQQQFELDPVTNTLWQTSGQDQGAVLGRRRICAALQAA